MSTTLTCDRCGTAISIDPYQVPAAMVRHPCRDRWVRRWMRRYIVISVFVALLVGVAIGGWLCLIVTFATKAMGAGSR